MSERLEHTELADPTNNAAAYEASGELTEVESEWATGEHYSRMQIESGGIGDILYLSLPALTFLAKTQEELESINTAISGVLSAYTDNIVVGNSHEASLLLSINQAASDLAEQAVIIGFLRDKIKELTGSYEAAGEWTGED
jgi:hypothetical protein